MSAVGAAGLVGLFSVLAATSFPGRSAAASQGSTGTAPATPAPATPAPTPAAASTPPAAQDPLPTEAPQPPSTGPGSGGGRHPAAVSGGS
jgi:hypothetical protein